jgi:dihydropteroate synthase
MSAHDHIPLWMGIVNLTPDSFSDGGRYMNWPAVAPLIDAMLQAGVHIIDLGAESTRPGAAPIAAAEEWQRLAPVLSRLQERLADDRLRPLVSVDTYHPETARRALANGADMINDVSGLTDPAMIELATDGSADWIAMHSLSVPVEKQAMLPSGESAFAVVDAWIDNQLERWTKAGIDLNRVIVDPGIGFGKDPLQSLELLRNAWRLRQHGLRVLVGHSRKSFLNKLTDDARGNRDLATLGASLALCAQGIDILRVHDVPLHAQAYRGWSHALSHRGEA